MAQTSWILFIFKSFSECVYSIANSALTALAIDWNAHLQDNLGPANDVLMMRKLEKEIFHFQVLKSMICASSKMKIRMGTGTNMRLRCGWVNNKIMLTHVGWLFLRTGVFCFYLINHSTSSKMKMKVGIGTNMRWRQGWEGMTHVGWLCLRTECGWRWGENTNVGWLCLRTGVHLPRADYRLYL